MTEHAKARHNLLRLVAAGDDQELADFAKDVLAGRCTLRELAGLPLGGESVHRRAEQLRRRWDQLTETQRSELVARAAEQRAATMATLADLDVDTMLTELDRRRGRPPAPPRRASTGPRDGDDEDFSALSYLSANLPRNR